MGLIHDAPRAATVTTLEPTTVLTIHKQGFEQLLERSSSVSLAMVKEVSRRLRENDEMAIEDLQLKASELANAYQRLAQEDFARREFLATIAHELRTPLTAARGFLEMARTNVIDQKTLHMALSTVAKNLQQIISLVNDILFLQEVELVFPEMVPQEVGEIFLATIDKVKDQAKNNRISIHLSISPGLSKVLGHSKSLERALTMVLDNAKKFSPKGGVVEVSVDGNYTNIWIRIADSGVGIPADACLIFLTVSFTWKRLVMSYSEDSVWD